MKKTILISTILSVLILQLVSAETMCEFDFFIYKNDTVEFIKARSYIGNPESAELKSSDYGLVFVDASGKRVGQINLPVIFYVLDPLEEVDSIPLSVRQPCNADWNELQIYHQNERIFSASVKELLCNNDGICNNYETVLTCPNDCPSGSKDGWCDKKSDSICDPDCIIGAGDPDCEETKTAPLVRSKETVPVYCNNNSVCEIYENEVNCPSDCRGKLSTEVKTKIPQIGERRLITEKIKEGENKSMIITSILMALLIISIIISFKIFLKKKK